MLKRLFVLLFSITALLTASITIKESSDIIDLLVDNYKGLESFQGKFIQRLGDDVYEGDVYYKSPSKFKMIFKKPARKVSLSGGRYQTICSDGETLWTYVPNLYAASEQEITEDSGHYVSTSKGILRLKNEYYFLFYNNKREPEPLSAFRNSDLLNYKPGEYEPDKYLEEDSREAYHMRLRSIRGKARKTGFYSIHLWIDESGMIIRSTGYTTGHRVVEFVFKDIQKNVPIADKFFIFDPPAGVQMFENNFVPVEEEKEEE